MYLKIYEPKTSWSDSSDFSSDDETSKSRHIRVNNILVQYNRNTSNSCRTKSKKCKQKTPLPPPVSVCLSHCTYDVIRRVAQKFGYEEVNEDENWDMHWSEMSITVDQCKELKRFQKLNHFPGMLELCRKDLMARNLNRMRRLFPNDYDFFPKTWCIPSDLGEALTYAKANKTKTFILKPDASSRGKGIRITKSIKDSVTDIHPYERGVCQVYISKPFLIDGYKFDMRVYTLLTSCDPLRIYVYKEGLVRFASCRYEEPNEANMANIFMHLTNYSVNKQSDTYDSNVENSIKRKLSWFNSYMKSLKHDVEAIWHRVDDVIVKTILSGYPMLKHSYRSRFPNHNIMPACIELLGIDVLFDEELNPKVLEVNYSPSYQTGTELDREVKEALFSDLFAMIDPRICDKRKIMRDDRKTVRKRLLDSNKTYLPATDRKCFTEYFKQEVANKGGFRLVYPCPLEHDYSKYFHQHQNWDG